MSYGCGAAAPHEHAVSFYDGDQDVVAAVAAYAADGFVLGEPVLVVATAAHRTALDEALEALGWQPSVMRDEGWFVTLDAAETLATFMVDGLPDAARFHATVAPIVDHVRRGATTARVFGEMVALLWEEGNVNGALALEECWNELACDLQFSLLCAYPHSVLDQASLANVGSVCSLHSEVLPPNSYHASGPTQGDPLLEQASWAFLPVPKAIPALRRFVTGTLRCWGEEALVPDAALVVSEMATNAINHAISPFHASIVRSAGRVRISIEDAGPGSAVQRATTHEDISGRGIVIIDALSQRWGLGELPSGKVVWAEFCSGSANGGSTPFAGSSI